MQKREILQANAALDNLRQNLDMKKLAKEILSEENYARFMKSYKYTFWFQLLGTVSGFLVPSIILFILFHDAAVVALGLAIGVIWMVLWMIISQCIPQSRIYRKFAKWYRQKNASIQELDKIFYL